MYEHFKLYLCYATSDNVLVFSSQILTNLDHSLTRILMYVFKLCA